MQRNGDAEILERIEARQAGTGHRFLLKHQVRELEGLSDAVEPVIIRGEEGPMAAGE